MFLYAISIRFSLDEGLTYAARMHPASIIVQYAHLAGTSRSYQLGVSITLFANYRMRKHVANLRIAEFAFMHRRGNTLRCTSLVAVIVRVCSTQDGICITRTSFSRLKFTESNPLSLPRRKLANPPRGQTNTPPVTVPSLFILL